MKKAALIILDGFGIGDGGPGDGIAQADAPYIQTLFANNLKAKIHTEGLSVGLPDGQTGGSEVGHITIGAGRAVVQNLTKINDQIDSGEFFENPVLKDLFARAAKLGRIHLWGMISDAGIHSYLGHISGLLEFAKRAGIPSEKTFIHAFADGRDVGERTVLEYLKTLRSYNYGTIATIGGRYYGMDRDQNWDRIQTHLDVLIGGESVVSDLSPEDYVRAYYDTDRRSDYYIPPVRFVADSGLGSDDFGVFWNFRTDRARQICSKITEVIPAENLGVFGDYAVGAQQAFAQKGKESIASTLGELVAAAGGTQLRISETEKFNHVTFFFSGETKSAFSGESRIMAETPKCSIFSEVPECAAVVQKEKLMEFIDVNPATNLIVQNYANADLVGHSGDLAAAIKAVEVLDECLAEQIPFLVKHGYRVLITADHGNADSMILPDGTQNASHTQNLVPCFVLGEGISIGLLDEVPVGDLADIAPTMCDLLDIETPSIMTGKSVLGK